MSGPKGYSYSLTPAQQRLMELQRTRDQWEQLCKTIDALHDRAKAFNLDFDVRSLLSNAGYDRHALTNPSDQNLDGISRLDQLVRESSEDLSIRETSHLAHAAREAITTMSSKIGGGPFVATRLSGKKQSLQDAPTQAAKPEDEPLRKELDQVIELIGELRAEQVRGQLVKDCLSLLEDSKGLTAQAVEKKLRIIKMRATDIVRSEREMSKTRIATERLMVELAGIHTPAADTLRTAVSESTDRASIARLKPQLDELVRLHRAEEEREFVIATAKEAWRELGYETGPEFEELALEGKPVLLSRLGWKDHALQVRFPTNQEGIATNIVALDKTSAIRDREVEEDHCASMDEFANVMVSHGVIPRLERHRDPGELPVQRIERKQKTTNVRSREGKRSADG